MPGEYFREFSFSFGVSVRLEVIIFHPKTQPTLIMIIFFGLLAVLTRWEFHPLHQDGGSIDFDFESVEVSTYGSLLSGLVLHWYRPWVGVVRGFCERGRT